MHLAQPHQSVLSELIRLAGLLAYDFLGIFG